MGSGGGLHGSGYRGDIGDSFHLSWDSGRNSCGGSYGCDVEYWSIIASIRRNGSICFV